MNLLKFRFSEFSNRLKDHNIVFKFFFVGATCLGVHWRYRLLVFKWHLVDRKKMYPPTNDIDSWELDERQKFMKGSDRAWRITLYRTRRVYRYITLFTYYFKVDVFTKFTRELGSIICIYIYTTCVCVWCLTLM